MTNGFLPAPKIGGRVLGLDGRQHIVEGVVGYDTKSRRWRINTTESKKLNVLDARNESLNALNLDYDYTEVR